MRKAIGAAALLLCACALAEAEQQHSWTKPETITVTCEEWAEVPHGTAVYFNNVWNVQAAGDFAWRQCIERDLADEARLGWSWHWPSYGENIYAQPQVKIGTSPWAPLPKLDDRFPVKVGELASMTVSADLEVNARGEHNIVTTLWLTDTGEIGNEAQPESIVAEVMIWTYATDNQIDPAGAMIGTVDRDGRNWKIWLDEDWGDVSGANANRWIYLAFVAEDSRPAAIFDAVALLRSERLSHLGLEDAYIADVELGSEIMRGDGLIWVDRFDVELEWK